MLRFILLLIVAMFAYALWQRWPKEQIIADTGEEQGLCSRILVKATALPTNNKGKQWDSNSPPDLMFQVGSRTTEVCHDTFSCERRLPLLTPARRFDLEVWDRDEEDNELIASGRVSAGGPEGNLGSALIRITCLEWVAGEQ